jgi:drug/metabolite transporter (DMT)-like permease
MIDCEVAQQENDQKPRIARETSHSIMEDAGGIVLAIVGGLGAAAFFATATLCSARSSRLIPPGSVLAWVMLTGLLVTIPALALVGRPHDVTAGEFGWLAVSGAGNVVGLLFAYSALRIGKVALIAPILSTEGALAAAISVLDGESLETASELLLVFIVAGVALAAAAPDSDRQAGDRPGLRPILFATLGAVAFGASLFATGHASETLPVPWVLLPARLIGMFALTLPLAFTHQLRLTRAAVPLVVTGGVCEVLGFASFALGSRHGLAVAAVLASQFAALAGLAAFVLFQERLSRLQLSGVTIVAVGVAALSIVHS